MTQEEVRERVLEILKKGYVMSLATVDEGGPWVSDVIYVYDDALTMYWQSMEKFRHSQALLKNPRTAGTITLSNKLHEPDEGLQLSGHAEKLEGEQYELAVKDRAKRELDPIAPGESTLMPGQSWYKLTPTKIELIYEPALGYQKVALELI